MPVVAGDSGGAVGVDVGAGVDVTGIGVGVGTGVGVGVGTGVGVGVGTGVGVGVGTGVGVGVGLGDGDGVRPGQPTSNRPRTTVCGQIIGLTPPLNAATAIGPDFFIASGSRGTDCRFEISRSMVGMRPDEPCSARAAT